MKSQTTPTWLEDAVFYEIYPQSFCDSNGDGIGDIPGIITRIPRHVITKNNLFRQDKRTINISPTQMAKMV